MFEALRHVTRFELELSSFPPSTLSKLQGAEAVCPQQHLSMVLRATLVVPPAEASSNDLMKLIGLELGEHDPIDAWKLIMRSLSISATATLSAASDAASVSDNGMAPMAAREHAALVSQWYAPSEAHMHHVTPFSYLSLTPSCTAMADNHATPSTFRILKMTHEVEGRMLASTVQYTYALPTMILPQVNDSVGCIAIILSAGKQFSSIRPVIPLSTSAFSTVTNDACMASSPIAFMGTLVFRIRIHSTVNVDCTARVVSFNRTHVQVAITNVSSKNLHVTEVDFDLLSTKIGASLFETRSKKCPTDGDYSCAESEMPLAPSADQESFVFLLKEHLSVLPLATEEPRPHLQPKEVFCFQFLIQAKSHVAHALNEATWSKIAPLVAASQQNRDSSRRIVLKSRKNAPASSIIPVSGSSGDDAVQQVNSVVDILLKHHFTSTVRVHYQTDDWEDPKTVLRSDACVTWKLL